MSNIYDIHPLWMLFKRLARRKPLKPVLLDLNNDQFASISSLTFAMIVSPEFDTRIPNASMTARLGWCHGFRQIGFPFRVINILELDRYLPRLTNPICWLTEADYRYLTNRNLRILRHFPHIVWVNTWFQDEEQYLQSRNLPDLSSPMWLRKRILESEPCFVFTISPQQCFEFYEEWVKNGLRLLSLPLAWDNTIYPQEPRWDMDFDQVTIAFVGGYWKYKAQQLDQYLKPHAKRLTVYGYSKWPYGNYGGVLPLTREGALYRQAKIAPTINEPHVEIMGIDINERVFKVLGSGGFTITDAVPAYREWFSTDELLIPENVNEFHEILHLACKDQAFNHKYRKTGQRAVIDRHQYSHRAISVLETLSLDMK